MAATKIMVIRHAEKPGTDGSVAGVTPEGTQDPEELIVRGWQRSGALVRIFAPPNRHFSSTELSTPNVIFASGIGKHSSSLRPQHTVLALAQFIGLTLDLSHLKGQETDLVTDAVSRSGTVLIAWEHQLIPTIANQILGNSTTCPQSWPGTRFDLVWVFDRTAGAQTWSFTQVPQMLLPEDSDTIIPLS